MLRMVIKKNKIKSIIVDFQNLTIKEQLNLWEVLFKFADEQLPSKKILMCYTIGERVE